MTDKERAKLYSDSFNAAIADRDRLKAEVERLTAEVDALNTANDILIREAQTRDADRDRLRGALAKAIEAMGPHSFACDYLGNPCGECDVDVCPQREIAAECQAANGDGDGEGGQG